MRADVNHDVIVMYSDEAAVSAVDNSVECAYPFPKYSEYGNYNQSYEYMLKQLHRRGVSAVFSTSADIVSPGTCKSYWDYQDGSWEKVEESCYAENIFDKFAPTTQDKIAKRRLLLADDDVRPFNSDYLSNLFSDKLLTYQNLTEYTIPTVELEGNSKESIEMAVKNLRLLTKLHPNSKDFARAIILKDRYGAGGEDIFQIKTNYVNKIMEIVNSRPIKFFVLQPFLKFSQGYMLRNKRVGADIRLIFQNEKLVQTYIRIAKKQEFRCNTHQGGKTVYIKPTEIPAKVLKLAHDIVISLERPYSLYALDFVISDNGNPYLIEGNTGPGINWNPKAKEEEIMTKKLIDGIVDELAYRVKNGRSN